jgi:uncharacterized lipoprotein YddW (UPF0748 family)
MRGLVNRLLRSMNIPVSPPRSLLLASILLASLPLMAQTTAVPPPVRELRGSWIATVANINWPTQPGQPAAVQQQQLRRLIQSAADLGLNCLVFQVRPAADAFYDSPLEPWSPYLTGQMGQAPSPKWDPLEFAITEAHKRGMELHAWFNPFRAALGERFPPSAGHVRRQKPEWTFKYAGNWWMNPGVPEVRKRAVDVVLDVTRRYDVDGIHIDDYFYPYPEPGPDKKAIPFPDQETYAKYQGLGGLMDIAAWRRQNVDETVQQLYEGIKATKRWVKFGVSPFGLWRPNYPVGTGGGLDPYEHMGADSRKWLQQGWLDYLTPQLYWTIDRPKLGFTTYYDWWLSENTLGRHIWPGMNTSKVGDDRVAGEILREISVLRERGAKMVPGHFHYNFGALDKDLGKVATMTKERAYPTRAIPPATPWLSNVALPAPIVQTVTDSSGGKTARWAFNDARWENFSRWWVVQGLINGKWQTVAVTYRDQKEMAWPKDAAAVAVRAAGKGWEVGPPGM